MKQILASFFLLVFSLTATAQDVPTPEEKAEKAKAEQEANDALPNASSDDKKAAWLTSIEAGLEKAQAENKLVLVEFTGSDWCPPCMMMAKKVFGKKAFLDGVKKDYVIVKLDMPNSNKALKQANELLMKTYEVEGVPTIILMDAEGAEFNRFTASEHRTVKEFLERLAKEKRRKNMF